MHQVVQQIAKEYKAKLRDLYGPELSKLILFGSYARGDYNAESDVDFAIVLHDPAIRPAAEILKTSAIASGLSLKYGIMVSSLHVSLDKKQISQQGVYCNIRKEGIVI
jgi:predicted nucleotidyltransferase